MGGMGKTSSAISAFVMNFVIGYLLGRLIKGRRAGLRAGLGLGVVGAVGSYLAADRLAADDFDEDDAEPIEIEV